MARGLKAEKAFFQNKSVTLDQRTDQLANGLLLIDDTLLMDQFALLVEHCHIKPLMAYIESSEMHVRSIFEVTR